MFGDKKFLVIKVCVVSYLFYVFIQKLNVLQLPSYYLLVGGALHRKEANAINQAKIDLNKTKVICADLLDFDCD